MARELAAAVVAHPKLSEYGGLSLAALRADREAELDLSSKGMRAAEARVLSALLGGAPTLSSVNLDGEVLPIRRFRGGVASETSTCACS